MSMYPFYRSCNKILRKYIQTKLRKLKYAIMKVKKKMEIKIIFDYKLRQTDRQTEKIKNLFTHIHSWKLIKGMFTSFINLGLSITLHAVTSVLSEFSGLVLLFPGKHFWRKLLTLTPFHTQSGFPLNKVTLLNPVLRSCLNFKLWMKFCWKLVSHF